MDSIDSFELEKNIIGYCYMKSDYLEEIMYRIKEIDFDNNKLREIFGITKEIYIKNKIVQLPWLLQKSNRETMLDVTNMMNQCGLSCDIESTIDLLLEKSYARKLSKMCQKVVDEIRIGTYKTSELTAFMRDVLVQIETGDEEVQGATFNQLVDEWVDDFNEFLEEPNKQVMQSGYSELDKLLSGFYAEQLILIAARPAVGKTTFALNIMRNLLKDGYKGLFVTFEMSKKTIFKKMISDLLDIEFYAVKMNDLDLSVVGRVKSLKEKGLDCVIIEKGIRNLRNLRIELTRRVQKDDLQFIIIDYMQLIDATTRGSTYQEVSEVSMALKQMAREFKVPMIVLSQLSRNVDSRPDPTPFLSDLRDSGSLEADADVVIFLSRKDIKDPNDRPGQVKVTVAKNREGKTGSFELTSDLGYSRILDRAIEAL